jgi:multisubunit Na+/H+ antiporter MnhG subunit
VHSRRNRAVTYSMLLLFGIVLLIVGTSVENGRLVLAAAFALIMGAWGVRVVGISALFRGAVRGREHRE